VSVDARPRQPRHDVHLPSGNRPRGDHRGRAHTTRADDVRQRWPVALIEPAHSSGASRRSRSALPNRSPVRRESRRSWLVAGGSQIRLGGGYRSRRRSSRRVCLPRGGAPRSWRPRAHPAERTSATSGRSRASRSIRADLTPPPLAPLWMKPSYGVPSAATTTSAETGPRPGLTAPTRMLDEFTEVAPTQYHVATTNRCVKVDCVCVSQLTARDDTRIGQE
jgi:hypothetical protein